MKEFQEVGDKSSDFLVMLRYFDFVHMHDARISENVKKERPCYSFIQKVPIRWLTLNPTVH